MGALVAIQALHVRQFRLAVGDHHQAIFNTHDGRLAQRARVTVARRGVAHDET